MITDLEEAIKIHLNNERKGIRPGTHTRVKRNIELHIRIFEKAPRDSKSVKALIERRKQVLDHPNSIEKREDAYVELQAYERLLGMIRLSERCEPLDGVAY
jgi:hypothetical protein